MKRFSPLLFAVLLALAGCAPTQASAPGDTSKTNELTAEQKTYLEYMDMDRFLNDPIVLALVSFPEDAAYANDNYRLTLCARYADYADKRLLVKVEPVSQEARDTFRLYSWNDIYKGDEDEIDEDIFRVLSDRMPDIHYPGDTNIIYWNSSDEEVTPPEATDARYYYFTSATTDTEGFLYFPKEYVNWKTGEYLAELEDISLKVDLTPASQRPLVFDVNLPLGEEGLVLDTLTLGVLSTQITYPPAITESVYDILNAQIKRLPITWVGQNGTETEFDRLHAGLGGSKYTSSDAAEAGVGQGYGWTQDRSAFPTDQVFSLTIDEKTYVPRA